MMNKDNLPITNKDKWYKYNTNRNTYCMNHSDGANYEFYLSGRVEHIYYRKHVVEGIKLVCL